MIQDEWRPIDIEDLEPNAWRALRREGSTLVVAGPGAGKTEFLAQRVAYLLQTGLCPAPYRVLAISFKVDAATNLRRRVEARCTAEEARRFVSLTFDAFTKSLVDRFRAALPQAWRPSQSYQIDMVNRPQVEALLQSALREAPPEWQAAILGLSGTTFEPRTLGSFRLNPDRPGAQNGLEFVMELWWQERLGLEPSSLTFTCLNRLAELALRVNPAVRRALLATYPYVLIDEFQDTTYAQYDFLESIFYGTNTDVTAVGDNKQRIMAWAGARSDGFTVFQERFHAERFPLLTNYRSSPELVHLQTIVGRAIDPAAPRPESQAPTEIRGTAAEIWRFSGDQAEATHVAEWLQNDMEARENDSRDYALLVRQKANDYEARLKKTFEEQGLRIRNESRAIGRTTLQDLLSEDFTSLALSILKLAIKRRAPQSWSTVNQALSNLRAYDPEDDAARTRAQDGLTSYISTLRREMARQPDNANIKRVVDSLSSFLDLDTLRAVYPQYATSDQLEIAVEAFTIHLTDCAGESKDWAECLDFFEGMSSVPLMTVHKSKGLEYDTIIFLGLDDENWWSFKRDAVEGRSTFLVALSRAKQRVIFTYREDRARWGIDELYGLLRQAGVPEKEFTS
ncbi:MAG: ATP-dependent helicase [Dehalococcoidia bacterium]|nr:ATP-dependent helicase [Dehalococcoidia bacterium]